ncbi:Lrp/AsnC family transcriptional regulator [Massilia sp. Dwa41.01b]|uniref:Lrp/AsnC family transcriptional regulator n=1 Tax=unclassified Massilia TaxID=2609279 RepID=UPI0016000B5F|nr:MULTISPECIES: Lrp/AsnC family transcriptional regulator [unclassified Massilia]QNA89296.1 Lrp/AsnC family transcriptional regulator [Massilia sp. Dwa41.01b]QNB00198.1 Lrp/AsnC family transcriptional regulator [Massilia sp. Se16.2.3]
MEKNNLDQASMRILRELQRNARLSINELSEKVGMSASPCWRRQKELEENGYIKRYAAILERRKLELGLVCMLHVSLTRHEAGVVETFEAQMKACREVMECYEVTGTSDYIVKLMVADMDAYHDLLHNVLLKLPGVSQLNTSVALREVKYETALPL